MSFKSFNLNDSGPSENVSKSLVMWLDDQFYKASGYASTDEVLVLADHPSYDEGRAWATSKKNWVWEDDLHSLYQNGLPLSGYSINHEQGLVILDTADTNAIISGYYSYKHILVIDGDSNDAFRGSNIDAPYSGVYREKALQTPLLAIELGPSSSDPLEIGSFSRIDKPEYILNVYHKNKLVVQRITDILYEQVDNNFGLFDFGKAYRSGLYPIELNGELINQSGRFDYLVENCPWNGSLTGFAHIESTEKEGIQRISNNLFHGTVRFRLECELSMI